MIFPEDKPCTPSELAHFGVKGMKWGVRRTRGTHDFYAKHPTSAQRSAAIDKARSNVETARLKVKAAPKGSQERAKAMEEFLKHPDTATALRLKRGEKVAAGIIATQGYLPITSLAAQAIVISRVGKRRGLEP